MDEDEVATESVRAASGGQCQSNSEARQVLGLMTVAPTPWGTGGTCPLTFTNGWVREAS